MGERKGETTRAVAKIRQQKPNGQGAGSRCSPTPFGIPRAFCGEPARHRLAPGDNERASLFTITKKPVVAPLKKFLEKKQGARVGAGSAMRHNPCSCHKKHEKTVTKKIFSRTK